MITTANQQPLITTKYSSLIIDELQKLQNAFGKSLNASVLITATDGRALTEPYLTAPFAELASQPNNRWTCCADTIELLTQKVTIQQKTLIEKCDCGMEIVIHPVIVNSTHQLNWVMLQLTGLDTKIKDKWINKFRDIQYTIVDATKLIEQIEPVSKMQFELSVNLLTQIADTCNYLLYNKVDPVTAQTLSNQNDFNDESLTNAALRISEQSQNTHSIESLIAEIKNVLLSLFKDCTVSIDLSDTDFIQSTEVGETQISIKSANTKTGSSLTNYVLKTKLPLLVSKAAIDLMFQEAIISQPKPAPVYWLGVPLTIQEQTIGVIAVQTFTENISLADYDKERLVYIAKHIAFSIQKIINEGALTRAKNEAEESSRLKSSLLANMSHELRTPMTGILGFSEILHEELEDSRLKNMASTIFKSANRLMTTLNSIMDLSSIESNRTGLALHTVNVKNVFMPLLRNAYSIASDKGLYLRTALPPNINVIADDKLLGQMLHHLIDNALKFTIDGGISISTYSDIKNQKEVLIKISDTGIGIDARHHKLIFEEFRQVSEGLSRNFEGSGLGLSLVAKIARLINATIKVESIPDKGSDFIITLPSSGPAKESIPAISEKEAPINTIRLGRGNVPEVLIVEDNEINRRLAALYLREICNIDMAENGYIAIEKIKCKQYDAILMDINLGAGPNGIHVAHEIRKLETYKEVPIIAVTGYTMQGDREKLLSNGCSHYVAKPYDKKTLIKLFSGLLYEVKS